MIKAKVVSFTLSESVDSISKLDLESYLEDQIDLIALSSFYVGMDLDFDGLDVVIMTKEEYEDAMSKNASLRKSLNEKEGEICKLIVNNDVEQSRLRETIEELETENSKLKEDIFFFNKGIKKYNERVSELEKEVEKLKEENKALKNKGDEFSLKVTGGLFYYKED